MPRPNLIAIITAMIMFGGPASAQSAFSIDELRRIESLINAKDCGALRDYLRANPRFLVGADPLAVELRVFARDVDAGRLDCYAPTQTAAFRSNPGTTRDSSNNGATEIY